MTNLLHAHGRCTGPLALCAAIACTTIACTTIACGADQDPTQTTDATASASISTASASASASASTTTATSTTDGESTASPVTTGPDDTGQVTLTTAGPSGDPDSGPMTSAGPSTGPDDTGPDDTGPAETTVEEPSEFFTMTDPLKGGTMGTPVGGGFDDSGWTVTGVADRVYWSVPRLTEGFVEFTVANITPANLPLNDHEIFAMYEGGYDIEHPIGYDPEFRNNAYKSMIRIYGELEGPERFGKQKIMWGICPFGAPGYHNGGCPCVSPEGFFDEPFGGDGTWDGTPQRLRVEWKDGVTTYSRNGAEVLKIEWYDTGLTFGPEDLYVSLGNPRPEAVGSASMPIGAVFSDVVIEGWTGPVAATCGQ
jgi:hypothetical protein